MCPKCFNLLMGSQTMFCTACTVTWSFSPNGDLVPVIAPPPAIPHEVNCPLQIIRYVGGNVVQAQVQLVQVHEARRVVQVQLVLVEVLDVPVPVAVQYVLEDLRAALPVLQ